MILEIILLALAIPAGFIIAWMARDELVAGRQWFGAIMVFAVIVGAGTWWVGEYAVVWSCGFILIVTLISWITSYKIKSEKSKMIQDN